MKALPPQRPKLLPLLKYIELVKSKGIREPHAEMINTIKKRTIASSFYTFKYNFSTDYKEEKLDYFDIYPLVSIFNLEVLNGVPYFWGLNLHHMPPFYRMAWFKRMEQLIHSNRRIDYNTLINQYRLSKKAIRRYRIDRVGRRTEAGGISGIGMDIYALTPKAANELAIYMADTFYGVGAPQAISNFPNL